MMKAFETGADGVVIMTCREDECRHSSRGVGGSGTHGETEQPRCSEPIEFEADKVILSTGIESRYDNKTVSDMLKVPLDADGFYVEAHMKLRPVEFATEGVYLCGLAHSPKAIAECSGSA